MKKISKGFTLLEILVVIGIIAVLLGFASASYSTAQKKARDAKRSEDMKSVQHALEQYYALCDNAYPNPLTLTAGTSLQCNGTTLITMPSDPLGNDYQCGGTCDGTEFMICPPDLGSGSYMETTDCNSTNKNCCVSNQQ